MAFLPQRTYLEETLVKNYDLSNGITAFTSSDISQYITTSLQVVYTSIQGSTVFVLEQSNDNLNWSEISEEYEFPVGGGNFMIDKGTFSGKYLRVNLKITGNGIVSIYLLAKR